MLATKNALIAFTIGLPAFLAVKIFAPGFFANHDTKTPFKIAMLCVGVNLFFNLILVFVFHMAHVGMALATSIAGWVNVAVMVIILRKRGIFAADDLLIARLIKMLIASAIMAIVLMLTQSYFTAMYDQGTGMKILALSSVIAIGMGVYGAAILILKAYDASMITKLVRRKR
jgi:putative peptidoglycan lipid II flippase